MPLALIVFFASGFAALLYQVVWQRLLVLFSGADVVSVTIIVAAFMAGLGCGSLAGGRLADRLDARRNLWAFALAELAIGLFGLVSKTFYYDVLYGGFPELASTPGRAALILFASLLPPTFCMGLSLPLLARALTGTLAATGRVVGSLYGWNTMGAATGAFVSTWVLLPRFGLEGSLRVGAALNLGCAVAAVLIGVRAGRRVAAGAAPTGSPSAGAASMPAPERVLPFRAWALVYGLTGFIALAFEIAWFRLLGVMLKSTAFTFGTLLGWYLLGLGLGAAVAARTVERSREPGAAFLLMQYGLTLYAAATVIGLVSLLSHGYPADLVGHLGGNEALDVFGTALRLRDGSLADPEVAAAVRRFLVHYVLLPAIIVGPPTLLMGWSFPYLLKASQADLAHLGRRVGSLIASNIAGSTLGAAACGWLLLPVLGTAGTLKLLVALGALIAFLYARLRWPAHPRRRAATTLAALALTGTAVLAMPAGQTLWARLHATSSRRVLVAEDGGGVSLLKARDGRAGFVFGEVWVFVNGLSQSWIPYGDVHTALGALPALMHPAPRDIAVIGLGSGDTAFSSAARPEVQHVVCVEIIGVQLDTLRRLERLRGYPGLRTLLTDPRFEHRIGDGRSFLLHTSRRFDIIEADALRPTSAHSGNLYSREYFDLLRQRLKPGGLAVTWAPTERVRRTFLSVFPHVVALADIYVGSEQPIRLDPAEIMERASAVRQYYADSRIDIEAIVKRYLDASPRVFGPEDDRSGLVDLNTDTFPRDEFALPFGR